MSEEEINQVYAKLVQTRRRIREINQQDTGGMDSSTLRVIHEEYLQRRGDELEALMEIERLKLIIQSRIAEGKPA